MKTGSITRLHRGLVTPTGESRVYADSQVRETFRATLPPRLAISSPSTGRTSADADRNAGVFPAVCEGAISDRDVARRKASRLPREEQRAPAAAAPRIGRAK